MAARQGVAELEWMLDHELLLAERYRRFVSVTMIKSDSPRKQRELIAGTIRNSDVYFEFNDSLGAVLMSETDTSGAITAAHRYCENCEGVAQMRFAVASYPQDHLPASEFVSTVYQRMKAASDMGPGAIVSSN